MNFLERTCICVEVGASQMMQLLSVCGGGMKRRESAEDQKVNHDALQCARPLTNPGTISSSKTRPILQLTHILLLFRVTSTCSTSHVELSSSRVCCLRTRTNTFVRIGCGYWNYVYRKYYSLTIVHCAPCHRTHSPHPYWGTQPRDSPYLAEPFERIESGYHENTVPIITVYLPSYPVYPFQFFNFSSRVCVWLAQ